MKTIKSILYSLYARILWLIVGLLAGITAMYALGGSDKNFRRYVNDRWKT